MQELQNDLDVNRERKGKRFSHSGSLAFLLPFVPALGNIHHSQTALACFFSPFFILERGYIES